MNIARDLGGGAWIGRIKEQVYAVGWDGRFLVAKQHPSGSKAITHYFIIDSTKNSDFADPKHAVFGPLSESEFLAKAYQSKLPASTKILKSLELLSLIKPQTLSSLCTEKLRRRYPRKLSH